MKIVWVVVVYSKRCVWGSFRDAWHDYWNIMRDEPWWAVCLYPSLRRQVNYDKLPEHKGW